MFIGMIGEVKFVINWYENVRKCVRCSGVATGGGEQRGQSATPVREKFAKNREKIRKNREKRGKIGKKRQKSGRFFHFAPPDR